MSVKKLLRLIVSILSALALGLIGLGLLFSDLGPGESIVVRLYTAEAIYLVSGLVIGFINADFWWLAGITAWGGIVLSITAIFGGGDQTIFAPVFVISSLLPCLLGGYLGALLRKKEYLPRLFRRR